MTSARWTEDQLAEHMRKNGAARPIPPRQTVPAPVAIVEMPTSLPKPSKYRSTRVIFMRRRFDSKLEARYFKVLWDRWHDPSSNVLWFTRQVPFELEGGVILRVDFQVVLGDKKASRVDAIEIIDCKGMLTRVAINKIKGAEDRYPIKIKIVTKADVVGVKL